MASNRPIKYVVVHCSASPDSMIKIGVKEISDWHKERGFNEYDGTHCGYHYVIRRDAGCVVETGRKETTRGAHAKACNQGSIGICIVGKKLFKPQQIEHLFILIDDIMTRHNLSIHDIYGHREWTRGEKLCPNFIYASTFLTMNHFRKALEQWRAGDDKTKKDIIDQYSSRCGIPYMA